MIEKEASRDVVLLGNLISECIETKVKSVKNMKIQQEEQLRSKNSEIYGFVSVFLQKIMEFSYKWENFMEIIMMELRTDCRNLEELKKARIKSLTC